MSGRSCLGSQVLTVDALGITRKQSKRQAEACKKQCRNNNVSTSDFNLIPWLPNSSKFVCIQHSAFYSRFIANGGCSKVIENRLNAFETFACAFPFYLAGRYHQMDGAKLQQCCEREGMYWTNAGNYLRAITDQATIPYYNLMKGAPRSQKIKFEGGKELCESAAEFLLEPWVLIQLPFQPALLHQWAVAALAETLRFCKKLVEIGTVGYAPQFHEVFDALAEICLLLQNISVMGLSYHGDYCSNPEAMAHQTAKRMTEYLKWLPMALSQLEFIFSDDCSTLLTYIKQQSWSQAPEDLQIFPEMSMLSASGHKDIPIFFDLFWRNPQRITSLMETMMPDKKFHADARSKTVTRYMVANHIDLLSDPHKLCQIVLSFGTKCVFDDGLLKGMKKPEEFFNYLHKHLGPEGIATLKNQTMSYWASRDVCSSAPKFYEGGVIQQVLGLQADVYAEHAIGTITRLMWTAAKKFDNDVYLDLGDEPILAESQVEGCKKRLKNLTAAESNWTREAIMKKCRATIVEQAAPDQNLSSSANKTVEGFTRRIRTLVLKMYEKQYTTLMKRTFQFYPECPYVQYALPCFVTMYIDAEKDKQLDKETTMKFKKFVHDLIGNYEEKEFVLQIDDWRRKKFFFVKKAKGDGSNLPLILETFSSFFGKSKKLEAIAGVISLLGKGVTKITPYLHPKPELFTPNESVVQLDWICSRIVNTVLKAESPKSKTFLEQRKRLVVLTCVQLKKYSSEADRILLHRLNRGETGNEIYDTKINNRIIQASKALTIHQISGLSLYLIWSNKVDSKDFYLCFHKTLFPNDICSLTIEKILTRDAAGLEELFAPLTKNSKGEDLSKIPLELAKSNLFCRSMLQSLTADGKVQMDHPGQKTFFPIPHCSSCGLVYCTELTLCTECKDEPNMPQPNFFCSEKCEMEAMDTYHREEHAQFVMKQLGIV